MIDKKRLDSQQRKAAERENDSKRAYSSPDLTEFGKLRELTHQQNPSGFPDPLQTDFRSP